MSNSVARPNPAGEHMANATRRRLSATALVTRQCVESLTEERYAAGVWIGNSPDNARRWPSLETRTACWSAAREIRWSSPGSTQRIGAGSSGSLASKAERDSHATNASASLAGIRRCSFGYARARPSSAKSPGETTSSNRPSCQASSRRAGVPVRERRADMRTLTSRTARKSATAVGCESRAGLLLPGPTPSPRRGHSWPKADQADLTPGRAGAPLR
jgi:hypothetical protein